jgi:hypothetical protein
MVIYIIVRVLDECHACGDPLLKFGRWLIHEFQSLHNLLLAKVGSSLATWAGSHAAMWLRAVVAPGFRLLADVGSYPTT